MRAKLMDWRSRVVASATLMTWGNLAVKTASFALIMPLALSRLPQQDTTLYLLLLNLLGLLMIVDMGFGPTFSRLFTFAGSGVPIEQLGPNMNPNRSSTQAESKADVAAIAALVQASGRIYVWLSIAGVLLIGLFGTSAVIKLAENSANPTNSYLAWGILLAMLPCSVQLNKYGAMAQGLGHVAQWQRQQMWFSLTTAALSVFILLLAPSVLLLVFAIMGTAMLNLLFSRSVVNQFIRERCGSETLPTISNSKEFTKIWVILWPAAWRSGLGILLSAGIVQGSGVVVTHLTEPIVAGSYLLALHLMRGINMFAQSPFYSRLPELGKLYAQGQKTALLLLAQGAMRKAYIVFLLGWIGFGLSGDFLLQAIGSKMVFPSPLLWLLLGLGTLAERYGAMHMQLYSLSHKIIWHRANGVTGLMILGLAFILVPIYGVNGMVLAILLANVSFYCWYSAIHSYRLYDISVWSFEKFSFMICLTLAGLFAYFSYLKV